MGVFDQGGGGGRAPDLSINDNYALDQPYDISGEPTAETMQQINEMFMLLFKDATRNRTRVADIATFDVVPPAPGGRQTIYSLYREFNTTQYRSLSTSPQMLIPAPGPGLIVQPFLWTIEVFLVATPSAFNVGLSLSLRYPAGAQDLGTAYVVSNVGAGTRYQRSGGTSPSNASLTNDFKTANLPVNLRGTVDLTGGTLAVVRVHFLYTTLSATGQSI